MVVIAFLGFATFPQISFSGDLEQCIRDLKEGEDIERYEALDTLYKMGEEASLALPTLIEVLKGTHEDDYINDRIYAIILNLKNHVRPFVPEIFKIIQDGKTPIEKRREIIERLLGPIGEMASNISSQLIDMARKDSEIDLRIGATSVLGKIGVHHPDTLSTLFELLQEENEYVQYAARIAVDDLSHYYSKKPLPQKETLHSVIEGLRSDNQKTEEATRYVLIKIEAHAKDVIPDIVELTLSLEDYNKRLWICNILKNFETHTDIMVSLYSKALKNDDETVKEYALDAISCIGKKLHTLIPELLKIFREDREDFSLRLDAVHAISEMEEKVQPFLSQILEMALRDKNSFIRMEAPQLFRPLGPYAEPVFPELVMVLKHEKKSIRLQALEVVKYLGEHARSLLPELKGILQQSQGDIEIEIAVIYSIGSLKSHAIDILPEFKERLKKEAKSSVTEALAVAVGKIGQNNTDLLLELLDIALHHKNEGYRNSAAKAIGEMGTCVKLALPQLEEALKFPDSKAQERALIILGNIAQNYPDYEVRSEMKKISASLLPKLCHMGLHHEDNDMRDYAREVIGILEEKTVEILPQLLHALFSDKTPLRDHAIMIFKKISSYIEPILPQLKRASESDDHEKQYLAALILSFSDEKSDEKSEEMKARLPFYLQALLDESPAVRTYAVDLIESIRADMIEEEKYQLETDLRELFLYRSNLSRMDKQSILCRLVEMAPKWTRHHFKNPEHGIAQGDWDFALQSLGALFIAKAAPYCESAERILNQVIQELTLPEKPATPSPFAQLGNLAKQILPFSEHLRNSTMIYGKQFYVLLLKEILAKDPLQNSQRKSLEQELIRATESLTADIRISRFHSVVQTGSLFQTHLLATSLLAVPDDEGINLLKSAIHPDDPLMVSYIPGMLKNTTHRDSAARAITTYFILYQLEKETNQKKQYRNTLIKALEQGVAHLASLVMHFNRDEIHLGEDDLAPYYYFSNIPFATAATRLLQSEKETTEEEQAKLKGIEEWLTISLLNHIQDDGLFKTPGPLIFHSAPAYINPLAGLALIPLIHSKNKK